MTNVEILRPPVVAPPPLVEGQDFAYLSAQPARRLQAQAGTIGADFQTIATAPQADVWVKWRAALPRAGCYRVAVFVPRRHATATQARYAVHGSTEGDAPVVRAVNQDQAYDAWVPLGLFEFDPAQKPDIFVQSDNASDESPPREMAFAEVRWELLPDVTVSNQDVINTLFLTAPQLGLAGWPLVETLGWQELAAPAENRGLRFDRARLHTAPAGVTAEQWTAVSAAIDALYTPPPYVSMPEGFHALPGVHGPADSGDWAWTDAAINAVRDARVEAVKVLVPEVQAATIQRLLSIPTVRFVMARLFVQMPQRIGTTLGERADFLVQQATQGNLLGDALAAGVHYFEVHNEPNLTDEGMFANWQNGGEFAEIFLQAVARLRASFPGALFGFPGCSPGLEIPNRRYPMDRFLAEAAPAIDAADFVCAHFYWGRDGSGLDKAVGDLRAFCEQYPGKVIFLSEFSNNALNVPKADKGAQYQAFYTSVQSLPPNLGAVFSYCLSSTAQYEEETWINAETGAYSGIVRTLAGI